MALADSIQLPWARLRGRYAQSGFARFMAWWLAELATILPARLRAALAVEEARIVFEHADSDLIASRARGGALTEIARVPLDGIAATWPEFEARLGADERRWPRVLVLPQSHVLRRVLPLPAAARDNLRSVLGFELDRQTPFRPDQVEFDFRVLPHPRDAATIPVELVLLPKSRLDAELGIVGPVAETLSAIDVADGEGDRLRVNLLPVERRTQQRPIVLLANLGLGLFAALCLVLAMGKLLDSRAEAVERLEAEVEAQRESARRVAALRRSVEDAVEAANFLAVQKASQPSMVVLLQELTSLLPDDTYLTQFSARGGDLELRLLSDQAARLVEILEASDRLRDVALAGQLQRDPATGKDGVQIVAAYGPPPVTATEEAADARAP